MDEKKAVKQEANGGHKGNTFTKEDVKEIIENTKDGDVEYKIVNIGKKRKGTKYKTKYVVDIKIVTTVTEYRYYEDEKGKYNIPKEKEAEVRYGSMINALSCYFTQEMMAPLNKTSDFFKQITNHKIRVSEGTIVNAQKRYSHKIAPLVEAIKERLIEEKVLHVDETGVKINGKLNWLHTCCSKDYVYYEVHPKRGKEAIDAIGILASFINVLMHDHWKSYYQETQMTHAECNAHILRYLKGILISVQQTDVEDLLKLFVEMNEAKKIAISQKCTKLEDEEIERYSKRYDTIIKKWRKDLNTRMSKTKNTDLFTEERNLLNRLEEYKENHILFIKDFDVPFDNNLAERSLRMIKSKHKSAGGFRTQEGAEIFACIRSFISTCKSKKENLIQELIRAYEEPEYQLI